MWTESSYDYYNITIHTLIMYIIKESTQLTLATMILLLPSTAHHADIELEKVWNNIIIVIKFCYLGDPVLDTRRHSQNPLQVHVWHCDMQTHKI